MGGPSRRIEGSDQARTVAQRKVCHLWQATKLTTGQFKVTVEKPL